MEHEHFMRLYCDSVTAFVVIDMQCCEQCVVWTPAAAPDSRSAQLPSPVTSHSVLQLPASAALPTHARHAGTLARAAPLLAGHSRHPLAAHLLLASQVKHFRSHGFWTASCIVLFSRKSVPIRALLYQICLKLSNELISCWERGQGNEQYVQSALLS